MPSPARHSLLQRNPAYMTRAIVPLCSVGQFWGTMTENRVTKVVVLVDSDNIIMWSYRPP
jgi:hypothetical protein